MGLVDVFSFVAATAGALVGAVEGSVYLVREVSKLLFATQHTSEALNGVAVASERKLSSRTAKTPHPYSIIKFRLVAGWRRSVCEDLSLYLTLIRMRRVQCSVS